MSSNDGASVESKQNAPMTPKSVTIAHPESHTSYFDLGEPALGIPATSPKQRRSSGAKRPVRKSHKASFEQLPKLGKLALDEGSRDGGGGDSSNPHHGDHTHAHTRLHTAVTTWLKDERTKWESRTDPREKSYAQLAFEGLERILSDHTVVKHQRPLFPGPKRGSSYKRLRHPSLIGHVSDTEYAGDDPVVPTTDEVLDNSKTISVNGSKEEICVIFKNDIIKLAHTLKLKGWRRVALDTGDEIEVTRLSGALTNAVYVVFPPKDLPPPTAHPSTGYVSKRVPVKLLLRVYGPQASHLIDREKELEILKRLARKRIGPRLLGTFLNGRFEQFLHAKTLTAKDLRDREISQQIAKRMRELHDGMNLTSEERAAGPFVWQNWDRWVTRCEQVISWLDEQILNYDGSSAMKDHDWKRRGLVCGVRWSEFRQAVDKYRQWLKEKYGGGQALRESLIFAHNDTQYGNILRIEPSGESPLLLPSNEHKQLVVIDFEYANANTPGLEFANHFTEWCYDYHADQSWACHTERYPTPDEQARFIKAYVLHQAKYQAPPPPSTTSGLPSPSLAKSILDARAPPSTSSSTTSYAEEEQRREQEIQTQVSDLMQETRLWRIANSAQWVAWGIVQTKITGMEEALAQRSQDQSNEIKQEQSNLKTPHIPHNHEIDDANDEGEGFDYLAYSQDRAFFFWGDLLEMGLVKEEELPESVLKRAKRLKY